ERFGVAIAQIFAHPCVPDERWIADDEISGGPHSRSRVGVPEQRHALGFVRYFAVRHRVLFLAAPIPHGDGVTGVVTLGLWFAVARAFLRSPARAWVMAAARTFPHSARSGSMTVGSTRRST